jgi:alpha-beta hydrolase superfamily lysophospholipase
MSGDLESMDKVLADIAAVHDIAEKKSGSGTGFLVAHSMGGILGLLYLFRNQRRLSGAVFSGTPARVPDQVSVVLAFISGMVAIIAPRLPVQKVAEEGLATRDTRVVEAARADPYCDHSPTRARTGHLLLLALKEIDQRLGEIRIPLLVLHGAADPIVPPDSANIIVDRAAAMDKKVRYYPDMLHEVFNEIGRERVLGDVEEWVRCHLG